MNHHMGPDQAPSQRLKRLYLRPPDRTGRLPEFFPHYFFEAKVDIDDVRSGFHETRSVSSALEISPLVGDASWTADMVVDVDLSGIQSDAPAGVELHPLPSFVTEEVMAQAEMQFALHLMRHLKAHFYRNYALKIYSSAGETLWDFNSRCLEILNESFRRDLDGLREVFNRRLELLRERFSREIQVDEFDSAKWALRRRDCMNTIIEQIDDLFLNADLFSSCRVPPSASPSDSVSDLEEKLLSLKQEVLRDVEGLIGAYHEKASNIDEYVIHPGLGDIHIVRTCVLWMPRQDQKS